MANEEIVDPAFHTFRHQTRIVVPFEIVHAETQVVTAEGEAFFENGKSVVLLAITWNGYVSPIRSSGTLDHLQGFFVENPAYEFHWKANEHIRIE